MDTTAGEREKGSLEPLLTQPVKRHIVLLAKLGATVVFSSLTLLLMLTGLGLAFTYMPIDIFSVSVGPDKITLMFVACLPFVLFVLAGCALMVLVASFTKSYKEAQSYLGSVMLLPTLPLMSLMFLSPEPSVSNMWIPPHKNLGVVSGDSSGARRQSRKCWRSNETISTPLLWWCVTYISAASDGPWHLSVRRDSNDSAGLSIIYWSTLTRVSKLYSNTQGWG